MYRSVFNLLKIIVEIKMVSELDNRKLSTLITG